MKLNKLCHIALSFSLLLTLQCNDIDGPNSPTSNCGALSIVDSFTYESAATNSYTVNSAVVIEDCLVINISASGCDGNSWVMQLIDSDMVSESSPPQRYVKLFLVNNEACLAVINRVESFDIKALQVDGVNEIIINIDDFTEVVTYTY